ncbi:MAG: Gfo/Idh/MocA family oxidoreductase [Planctomycetota bacterium]
MAVTSVTQSAREAVEADRFAIAPAQKIRIGCIGIRNRGGTVLKAFLKNPDVEIMGIADVRADRREAVKQLADAHNGHSRCSTHIEMDELLSRNDVDAVLIATGDRWHAPASIKAARAGKDIYCEKPVGMTIDLCQRLDREIDRAGVVFQAGTQRRSQAHFAAAVDMARSGMLGKLEHVEASIYQLVDRHDWLPAQPEPAADVIDWDRWLGPAPWRPFNQAYVDGGWRGFHDFDSGARLLDWGAHTLDLCQWAAGQDGSAPIRWEPLSIAGDNVIEGVYDNGIRVTLRKSGWQGMGTCPVRFNGSEGWVETGDSGRLAVSHDRLKQDLPGPIDKGTDPNVHVRNFLNCVKTRRLAAANNAVVRSSHVACHAAAISWILGRPVTFDPVTESFAGDDEANRLRFRVARSGYRV